MDDLGLTFRDMAISIQDLSDYVGNVEPVTFHEDVPRIPIPKEPNLNFLKPGSHEVLSRPVHIHEHLPPIQQITAEAKNDGTEQPEAVVPAVDCAEQMADITSPHPFKRPHDGSDKRKG